MKNQRGSIIVFSVLMLTTMLLITLALLNIFLPKLRLAYDVSDSMVALFAADSAAERCLYEARQQSVVIQDGDLLTNGASFVIASLSSPEVLTTDDCRPLGTGSFRFRVVGTFRGVNRALELSQ
jgi:hypothetical protein